MPSWRPSHAAPRQCFAHKRCEVRALTTADVCNVTQGPDHCLPGGRGEGDQVTGFLCCSAPARVECTGLWGAVNTCWSSAVLFAAAKGAGDMSLKRVSLLLCA